MKKDPLDKNLFKLIICPVCKSDLKYNKEKTRLVCIKCKKYYKIRNNTPILLTK